MSRLPQLRPPVDVGEGLVLRDPSGADLGRAMRDDGVDWSELLALVLLEELPAQEGNGEIGYARVYASGAAIPARVLAVYMPKLVELAAIGEEESPGPSTARSATSSPS